MIDVADAAVRYCGRLFTSKEIDRIGQLITSDRTLNRAQLSRIVCDEFNWLRPDGRSKEMSCRVAMLRMQKDGLITLPPPQKGNGNGRTRPRLTSASDPKEPLSLPAGAFGKLLFGPVTTGDDSTLWNELIERYHYLGYKPLPGQCRRGTGLSAGQISSESVICTLLSTMHGSLFYHG